MDIIEEIKKLKALLDQGAINDEEFSLLKKKILSEEIDVKEPQKTIPSSSVTETVPAQEETKQPSLDVKEPIKDSHKSKQDEDGNQLTLLQLLAVLAGIILSIVILVRYSNFWIFIIVLPVSILIPISINKITPIASKRNLYSGLTLALFVLLIFVPIGSNNQISSSSSEQSSATPANDADKEVRDFIISHTFEDIENGVAFTLKFSSDRGGWFGIMTFSMGSCWALYRYEVKGRNISLTFDSSNCTNHGSSTTATFNNDNTVSLYYQGESFVFKPY